MTQNKQELNVHLDLFFSNIQAYNQTIYQNRANFARRSGILEDVKFMLDLFELVANSKFYEAYQKIQFMREYLLGAIPRPLLIHIRDASKKQNNE